MPVEKHTHAALSTAFARFNPLANITHCDQHGITSRETGFYIPSVYLLIIDVWSNQMQKKQNISGHSKCNYISRSCFLPLPERMVEHTCSSCRGKRKQFQCRVECVDVPTPKIANDEHFVKMLLNRISSPAASVHVPVTTYVRTHAQVLHNVAFWACREGSSVARVRTLTRYARVSS